MFLYVSGSFRAADLRQAGTPGVEPLQGVGSGAFRALIRFRPVGAYRYGVCLVRVSMICVRLGRASVTRISLGGVRLGGVLPEDICVLGARARLMARAYLSRVIARVGRGAVRGSIAVIGPISGAAQFGHASVCPETRSTNCG